MLLRFGGDRLIRGVRDARPRAPVAPRVSQRTGRPPPQSVIATCERMRAAPPQIWGRYQARCTGKVDWDLPGRSAVGGIPLLGTALNVATSLVPGAGLVAGALGLGAGATAPPRPTSVAPAGGGAILMGYYGGYPVVLLRGYGGAR